MNNNILKTYSISGGGIATAADSSVGTKCSSDYLEVSLFLKYRTPSVRAPPFICTPSSQKMHGLTILFSRASLGN